jgi:integrase
MGREPFERVGACQTLARQTAPTALAPVYHLTAWSPSRSSLWSFSNRSMSSGVTSRSGQRNQLGFFLTTWRAALALAGFAGLRLGEIRALTWADVDLEAGAMTVHRSMLPDGALKAPKTDAGNRTAPIMPALRRLLVAWRLRSPHTRPADPVICTASGGAVQERNLRRALADAKTAAGLNATEGRLSLHSLRHSWASALATGGLAATTLARVTGHSDPGFTYRVYARDARDDAALVADVLARAEGAGFGG